MLTISPSPYDGDRLLPLCEAQMIADASRSLLPLRMLTIQDLQHGACDQGDHDVYRTCNSSTQHTMAVMRKDPAGVAPPIHQPSAQHTCGHISKAVATPDLGLSRLFRELPHLQSLTGLCFSRLPVSTCGCATSDSSHPEPPLACTCGSSQRTAAPALAWALQQCRQLQELKLCRLCIDQSSAASIAAAWPTASQLCRLELDSVSHSARCATGLHGGSRGATMRCACRPENGDNAVPVLMQGVGGLHALTALILSGERMTWHDMDQVLRTVQQLPSLQRLAVRHSIISDIDTNPGMVCMGCMHDGSLVECMLRRGRASGVGTDEGDTDDFECGHGPALLILSMHEALARTEVPPQLNHLDLTECRVAQPQVRLCPSAQGKTGECSRCGARGRCLALMSTSGVATGSQPLCCEKEQSLHDQAGPLTVTRDHLGDCNSGLVDTGATGVHLPVAAQLASPAALLPGRQPSMCRGCQWFKRIHNLHLDEVCATGSDVRSLAKLIRSFTALQDLSFSGNNLGCFSIATPFSAALRQLSNLSALRLDNCQITATSSFSLLPALGSLPKLQELYLSRNSLRAEGAAVAAQNLPQLPKLSRLSLASYSLQNKGVMVFAEAIPNLSALRVLDLARNHVNEAAVGALVTAVCQLPQLREVIVYEEFFSKRSHAKLQSAVPEGCIVVFADTQQRL